MPGEENAALKRNLTRNLDALSGRDGALAGHIRRARDLSSGGAPEVHFLPSGRWMITVLGGDGPQTLADSERRAADAERAAERLADCRLGIFFMSDPGLLYTRAVLAREPADVNGAAVPVYLVETESALLRAYLQVADISAELAAERVIPFAGPDALRDLAGRLRARPDLPMPDTFLIHPSLPAEIGVQIRRLLRGLTAERVRQTDALAEELDAYWASEPWREAFAGERPLRLMALKPRRSTFVQYSMRDLAEAAPEAGVQMHLVEQPGDASRFTALGFMREAAAFRPDIVLLVDHIRSEQEALPRQVPLLTWIQDMMVDLCSEKAGRSLGERDFVMGWGKPVFVTRYGYPAERFLGCGIPTNPDRFPEPLPYTERTFRHDLSYVSHYSMDPEEAMGQFLLGYMREEGNRKLMLAFHDLVMDRIRTRLLRTGQELHALFDVFLKETGTSWNPAEDRREALVHYWNGPYNHAYRQIVLGWTADLAEEEGLDLAIYGRGWEKRERFAPYARGVADNRRDLGRITVETRVNLQIGPYCTLHQRLLDGLAAGGFFLVLDARLPPEFLSAVEAMDELRLSANGPRPKRFWAAVPPRMRSQMCYVLTGMRPQESRSVDWRRFMEAVLEMRPTIDFAHAFPGVDVERIFFTDARSLRERWEMFSQHPEEARAIQEGMRRATLEQHTYAALLRRLVSRLREVLAPEEGAP